MNDEIELAENKDENNQMTESEKGEYVLSFTVCGKVGQNTRWPKKSTPV